MARPLRFLQDLIEASVPPGMPPERARYVRFNTWSILLVLLYTLCVGVLGVAFWPRLVAAFGVLSALFYAGVLVLALRGHHRLSKIVFNYGAWVNCVLIALLYGDQYPGHWWLLTPAAYAALVYAPEERRWMLGSLFGSLATFVLFEVASQFGLLPEPLVIVDLGLPAIRATLAFVNVCLFGLIVAFVALLHHYARVDEAKLAEERRRSDRLLLNVLPEAIAARLKDSPEVIADGFSSVTVLFSDIVGFTQMSARLPPEQLVSVLNEVFTRFDALATQLGLEKIKTVGDAYMVVGGVPTPRADHAAAVARMALAMREYVRSEGRRFDPPLELRIGLHSGPVVAGVIGRSKFSYDLWGDTVNTASRMESSGEAGRIQLSEESAALLRQGFVLRERGLVQVKGKGELRTFWLEAEGSREAARPDAA